MKVDHSPRHYANTAPIRYVQQGPPSRGGYHHPMYDDYAGGASGGYDPSSYSTSYSTTELFQPTNGYAGPSTSYAASGGYVPQPPPQATQITYQTIQPQAPPPQQPQQQMMSPQNYAASSYTPQPGGHPGYGAAPPPPFGAYRPQIPGGMGYNPSPMNVGYPRQY